MVRARRRLGFTLVELLVVIGIIALLISVLLPALTKARAAALSAVGAAQIRQFGVGIQIYADQNKGALPQKGPDGSTPGANAFTTSAIAPTNPYLDDGSIWFNAIPPLVNGKSYFQMIYEDSTGANPLPVPGGANNIFICPAMSDAVGAPAYDRVLNNAFLLYGSVNPNNPEQILNSTGLSASGQFRFSSSYVFNSKLTSYINQPNASTDVKMSSLRPTSECVIMVEKLNTPGEDKDKGVQAYVKKYSAALNGDITANGFTNANIGQAKGDWRRFTTRHNGGGHILFADGHVQWYAWPEVQIQPSEMVNGVTFNVNLSDANQPGKLRWSIAGPVN